MIIKLTAGLPVLIELAHTGSPAVNLRACLGHQLLNLLLALQRHGPPAPPGEPDMFGASMVLAWTGNPTQRIKVRREHENPVCLSSLPSATSCCFFSAMGPQHQLQHTQISSSL